MAMSALGKLVLSGTHRTMRGSDMEGLAADLAKGLVLLIIASVLSAMVLAGGIASLFYALMAADTTLLTTVIVLTLTTLTLIGSCFAGAYLFIKRLPQRLLPTSPSADSLGDTVHDLAQDVFDGFLQGLERGRNRHPHA